MTLWNGDRVVLARQDPKNIVFGSPQDRVSKARLASYHSQLLFCLSVCGCRKRTYGTIVTRRFRHEARLSLSSGENFEPLESPFCKLLPCQSVFAIAWQLEIVQLICRNKKKEPRMYLQIKLALEALENAAHQLLVYCHHPRPTRS